MDVLVDTSTDDRYFLYLLFQCIDLSVLYTLFHTHKVYTPRTFSPMSSLTGLNIHELFLAGIWTVFRFIFPSSLLILWVVVLLLKSAFNKAMYQRHTAAM